MARQCEFDSEQVLDKAMHLFWKKGYNATSMAELEKGMGINKFSIYNSFGNKHQLFLAVLNHYAEKKLGQMLDLLNASPRGLAAIERVLDLLETIVSESSEQAGCLMLSSGTELSLHDADVSNKVRRVNRYLEDAFYQALLDAQKKGEISAHLDLKDYSRFLVSLYQGMMTVAKNEQDTLTVLSSIRFTRLMLHKL